MQRCLNDIKVVEASTVLQKIASGVVSPPREYRITGLRRNKPYWFCDGIYYLSPLFMSSVQEPVKSEERIVCEGPRGHP